MPKVKDRPLCKQCHKGLKKTMYVTNTHTLNTPDPTTFRFRGKDLPIVQITRRGPLRWRNSDNREYLRFWCGQYGFRGNNHFCSSACGMAYAVEWAINKETVTNGQKQTVDVGGRTLEHFRQTQGGGDLSSTRTDEEQSARSDSSDAVSVLPESQGNTTNTL